MARRSERARPRSLSSALTRGGGLCGNCRAATTQAFGRETSVLPRGSGRAAATPGGAGEGWPSPNQLLTLLPSPWLTMVGIRSEAAAAPRGGARRDRPHPPAPSPIAMGEGEKLIRGRAKPSPGPPDCRGAAASRSMPPLVSHGDGRGGATDSGEGLALPRTPGLPRRGRFPIETCPCQPFRWERGEKPAPGRAKPPRPRVAAARRLPNPGAPVSGCEERGRTVPAAARSRPGGRLPGSGRAPGTGTGAASRPPPSRVAGRA